MVDHTVRHAGIGCIVFDFTLIVSDSLFLFCILEKMIFVSILKKNYMTQLHHSNQDILLSSLTDREGAHICSSEDKAFHKDSQISKMHKQSIAWFWRLS